MNVTTTTRGLAVTWWKLCYQLFSPTLFYLTQNGTNRRLRLAVIRRVQERTKNTEIPSDKKTDGDFSLLCKVTSEGAPALGAVLFQEEWTVQAGWSGISYNTRDYTLPGRRPSMQYMGPASWLSLPGFITVLHTGQVTRGIAKVTGEETLAGIPLRVVIPLLSPLVCC